MVLHGQVEVVVDTTKFHQNAEAAPAAAPAGEGFVPTQEVASVLRPGDHIGEMALVVDGQRTASVRAVERCVLYCLARENFKAFLQVAPSLEEVRLHRAS